MSVPFRIGCSGFYNKHWRGFFYPEKLAQNKWFNFYCEHFNSLELNVTFYRFPTEERLQTWFKKSPDDFLFSVKAPKLITHYKKFIGCKRLLKDFYSACHTGLKNKLGCVLFQMPPSIQYSEEKTEQIISSLNPDFKNVLEFRHKSWWSKKVYAALAENKITFCSVSHPALPQTMVANTRTAYVRLHGIPKMFYSNYTPGEMRALRNALLRKKNVKEVYVYFNNTAGIAGVVNAREFKAISEVCDNK